MLDGTGAIGVPRIRVRRGRRGPRAQALAGLAAALAVLAAAWWASAGATPSAGPLAVGNTGGGLSSGPVLRGQWAVTTIYTTRLAGTAPAVIDSVSPAAPPRFPGLVLRYAAVAGKRGGWGFGRGWPPPGTAVHPLRGAVVRPGERAAILVAVTARHPGRWRLPAFRVRYHVGRTHYEATFWTGIQIIVRLRCRACHGAGQLAGRLT